MYTGKVEFLKKVNPEILDTYLELHGTSMGIFTYYGKYNDINISMDVNMNDSENITYHNTESVESLIESDNVQVYFNNVCALWVE